MVVADADGLPLLKALHGVWVGHLKDWRSMDCLSEPGKVLYFISFRSLGGYSILLLAGYESEFSDSMFEINHIPRNHILILCLPSKNAVNVYHCFQSKLRKYPLCVFCQCSRPISWEFNLVLVPLNLQLFNRPRLIYISTWHVRVLKWCKLDVG